MNDNPFAPPRDLTASTPEAPATTTDLSRPTHDTVELPSAAPGASFFPPAVPPAEPAAFPQSPATRPARLRRSTVAAIVAGSLVLGAGAGFGGAWAYDEFGPSSASSGAAATLPQSGNSTISSTDSTTVASVAASVLPSVVSIENLQGGQVAGEGSGFIIREDGYILTNNHVVSGSDGDTVTVVMSDGTEYEGEIVGATADYDLAVVKIDATGLTPLVLGDSDAMVVGDDVIAVGSPLGLEATVTTGIVSALHRPVTAGDTESTAFIDAIQTDAAINPGNSGGPLLNARGEVIGINSAIASLGSSASQSGSVGLGFAIPSNQARRTAEEIIATGTATYPVVGVVLDGTYTGEGVKVADEGGVASGGPADLAGIESGDVITAIDGRPITRSDELVVAIRAKAPDEDVVLTVRRGESEQDITVTLVANTEVSYGDSGEPEESAPEQSGPDGDGGMLPDPSE
ncbi:hypothetical protein Lsed01_00448 [Demequina sediminis]|uniref:PDZ domain-containing protein n=1 Tax=Demequina sediminis TaxID=1930058 RepID=A0ABP9WDW7_9MICO